MENKGLVSVIIPVYNVEEYLEECIESVLAQTYPFFEIILVDDGSSDSSKNICEKYVEENKKIYLICQENSGASAARNTGLRAANGEYIYFLDSDDWIEKEAFEVLTDCIKTEKSELVFFNAYSVDEDTEYISSKHYNHKLMYDTDIGYKILGKRTENKECHVTPWSMFFKKSFLDNHNILFREGIIYEDLIFTYKVFSEAKSVAYLAKFLYYRRYRENSVMTSKIKKRNFDSAATVYKEVLNYAKNQNQIAKCDMYIARCAYNVLNIYERLDKDEKDLCKEEFMRIKNAILDNQGHQDVALKLRCHHKLLWLIYKMGQRIIKSV